MENEQRHSIKKADQATQQYLALTLYTLCRPSQRLGLSDVLFSDPASLGPGNDGQLMYI